MAQQFEVAPAMRMVSVGTKGAEAAQAQAVGAAAAPAAVDRSVGMLASTEKWEGKPAFPAGEGLPARTEPWEPAANRAVRKAAPRAARRQGRRRWVAVGLGVLGLTVALLLAAVAARLVRG